MDRRNSNNNLHALEKDRDELKTKIADFILISDVLQNKTTQLLELIRKKEDYSGIFFREYDEVSNDINSVQTIIVKYSIKLEELEAAIEECKKENSAAVSSRNKPFANKLTNGDLVATLTPPQYRLPFHKCQLRAHLPDNQFTVVEVRPGQTIRQVLEKKLSLRRYRIEDLSAYSEGSGNLVLWDEDAAGVALVSGDLVIEFNDEQTHRRPKHAFQRRRFFETQVCSVCLKFVFFGVTCKTCGLTFHQRCVSRLEKHYLHPTEEDNFIEIQRLMTCSGQRSSNWLAGQNGSGSGTSSSTAPTTAQVCVYEAASVAAAVVAAAAADQTGRGRDSSGISSAHLLTAVTRERSSSSPNVCNHIAQPGFPNPLVWAAPSRFNDTNHPLISAGGGGDSSDLKSPSNPEAEDRPKSANEGSASTPRQRQRHDSIDKWMIPPEEIQKGPRIGSGSFGTVFKGYWHGDVAIKELNVVDPSPTELKAFKNEVNVLRKTSHANILLFRGCVSKPRLAIVTQWCEGSSLYKHIHVHERHFDVEEMVDIARQTTQGMDYLHAKKILHRDLKSSNIFLQERTVKIGDFGLATMKTWKGGSRQPTGSVFWMAPEVMRMEGETPYTNLSDVYAFGIVVYELITGQLPFRGHNCREQIIFLVGKGLLRPDMSVIRSDVPTELRRIVSESCEFSRDARPNFSQLHQRLDDLYRSMQKKPRCKSEPDLRKIVPAR
ncbi:hypothetical protein Aperf_G00000064912 [Anoplocephala perfoliata]